MESYNLGIDIGTSYFKAAVFDKTGSLRGLGRKKVPKSLVGNRCELSPVLFWDTLSEAIQEAVSKARININQIERAGYSSQANSFILLDAADEPLTDLILWPDLRAESFPQPVAAIIGREDFLKICGQGVAPGMESMIAKLGWFQENDLSLWNCTRKILTISDYLVYMLTGELVSDSSTASMTSLLDVRKREWWQDALDAAGIDRWHIPSLADIGTYVGKISSKGNKLTGLSTGVRFFLGGLDHHMAWLGAGNHSGNLLSESTGTVLACVGCMDEYIPTAGVDVAPAAVPGTFFRMAFNGNGASVLEWFRDGYAGNMSFEQLVAEAAEAPPGCSGLKALPQADSYSGLNGFQGHSDKLTRAHYVRAILESVSFTLKDLVGSVDKEDRLTAVAASGGGAKSRFWIQIKAAILGKEYIVPACAELACRGAAFIGSGEIPPVSIAENIQPDPLLMKYYEDNE